MGVMAIAEGVAKMPQFAAGFAHYKGNFAVPALMLAAFPSWFVGVAFAAIAIGAAGAGFHHVDRDRQHLHARHLQGLFAAGRHRPAGIPDGEAHLATRQGSERSCSSWCCRQRRPSSSSCLGGIWIIQTLPAVMLGLTRMRLRPGALLIGWALGMAIGTAMAASTAFKSAIFPLHLVGGFVAPGYAALYALIVNLVVSLLLSALLNALRKPSAAMLDPAARFEF